MWQPVHDPARGATIALLRNAIALAYPKPAVFSDASDTGWGTLVAQYPREQHGHVGVLSACSGSGAPASC